MAAAFSSISFLAGIAVGIIVTSAWFTSGSSFNLFVSTTTPEEATSTESRALERESEAISVADQPAGNAVTIESITVPPPGVWITVREANDTELGNMLGAAHISGPRSNVTVPLLRDTEPGKHYAVELYRDDAGGTFDITRNSVYVDFDTGIRVVAYFDTTAP